MNNGRRVSKSEVRHSVKNTKSTKAYVMQVDLQATNKKDAGLEASGLVVIPHETLNNLITLLDGRQLSDGETIASVIYSVKEYM